MISALVFATATAAATATLPPVQHLTTIDVMAPKAALHLQVAQTEAQRERGLMSVTKLPAHSGMIFVFETESQVEFWMKDTLIPLDMVWVSADGTVNTVATDVPVVSTGTPDDQIPRRHGNGKYVIELPAFEAKQDGIVPGAHLSGLDTLHD